RPESLRVPVDVVAQKREVFFVRMGPAPSLLPESDLESQQILGHSQILQLCEKLRHRGLLVLEAADGPEGHSRSSIYRTNLSVVCDKGQRENRQAPPRQNLSAHLEKIHALERL